MTCDPEIEKKRLKNLFKVVRRNNLEAVNSLLQHTSIDVNKSIDLVKKKKKN